MCGTSSEYHSSLPVWRFLTVTSMLVPVPSRNGENCGPSYLVPRTSNLRPWYRTVSPPFLLPYVPRTCRCFATSWWVGPSSSTTYLLSAASTTSSLSSGPSNPAADG